MLGIICISHISLSVWACHELWVSLRWPLVFGWHWTASAAGWRHGQSKARLTPPAWDKLRNLMRESLSHLTDEPEGQTSHWNRITPWFWDMRIEYNGRGYGTQALSGGGDPQISSLMQWKGGESLIRIPLALCPNRISKGREEKFKYFWI